MRVSSQTIDLSPPASVPACDVLGWTTSSSTQWSEVVVTFRQPTLVEYRRLKGMNIGELEQTLRESSLFNAPASTVVSSNLSPLHTSNNVEATLSNATMSNVASTLLPFLATMSKQRSTLLQKRQQCRTRFALKFRPFDKVERCFDSVAQHCRSNRQQSCLLLRQC